MSKTRTITPNPPADFTPEMGNYKTLQPFRYWCQKVLPLVYDDSLSYYELLCKVVDYLNKTMEDVETLHGDVDNLHTAYEQLQEYVNNYFSSLDVQEEINNKLDEMSKNGSLSNIIMPFIKSSPIIVNSVSDMTDTNAIYLLESDGFLYYWNGSSFIKSGINYSYPTNAFVSNKYRFLTAENKIADLNQCGSYAIGIVSGDNAPVDMPFEWKDGNYMVVVDGYAGGDVNNYIQKMYRQGSSDYYYRMVINNTGEWVKISPKDYKYHSYMLLTAENKIADLNQNGSYSIGIVSGDNVPVDMPFEWKDGNYIVVVEGYAGNDVNNYIQQMYRVGTSDYYYRMVINNTGEWVKISTKDYKYYSYMFLTAENKIADLNQNGSYSIGIASGDNVPVDMPFEWKDGNYMVVVDGYAGGDVNNYIQKIYKAGTSVYYYRMVNEGTGNWIPISGKSSASIKIGLCGDSFIATGGDGGLAMSDYLNKYEKYDAVSLARGGIKASEWWNEFNSQINNSFDVFLVSLGLNVETSVTVFKDSITTIINNLTTINPTARIILWCMDAWYTEEYSNTCEEIAKTFGIEFYSMKADARIPIRIGGKFKSKFPNLNDEYANIKTEAYSISSEDNHPNIKGRKMLADFWTTIL